MNPSASDAQPTAPPPRLRLTRVEDYPQIEQLEASHQLTTLSPEAWRHVCFDNPLIARAGKTWPIGWVLEDDTGRIVGSLGNVPTRYTFHGRELIAATGRAWVVAPEYRGVALWLMDDYFNQDGIDLFLNNTVNVLAVDAFTAFGSSRIPIGDWESAAYWITNYRGFAAAAAKIKKLPLSGVIAPPAALALRLRDALRARSIPGQDSPFTITDASGFDSRFDQFWREVALQNPDKLLCWRDRETLAWHFADPLQAGQAWIMTATRNNLLRAYAIFKRQDHSPSGLLRMRLVDYQSVESSSDLLPSLLIPALRRCVAESIHTLEHVGCDLPKMRSFDRFAPYRRRLLSWPFYYTAPNPSLSAELRDPDAWDPSTFDGDASL